MLESCVFHVVRPSLIAQIVKGNRPLKQRNSKLMRPWMRVREPPEWDDPLISGIG